MAPSLTALSPGGFLPVCDGPEYTYLSPNYQVRFSPDEIRFRTRQGTARVTFEGAGKAARLDGEDPSAARVHMLQAGTRASCRDLPVFQRLNYSGIYPGIAIRYQAGSHGVESEYRVAARTDPGKIRIIYSGILSKRVTFAGELELKMLHGTFLEKKPQAWQLESDGSERPVEVSWRLNKNGTAGFRLGAYDRSRELIIDPVIIYNTYISNATISALSEATGIAADSNGNTYVSGWIDGNNLGVAPVGQSANRGSVDAFLVKLNAAGAVVFVTYFGGSREDLAYGLVLDSSGRPWITGSTASPDLPILNPFQASLSGYRNAFVAEFSTSGTVLFASYLGGTGPDSGNGIATDTSGNVYIVGDTESANLNVRSAAQPSYGGGQDAFVAKISPYGSLLYLTYLGGNRSDHGSAIAVDSSGAAYVTGGTFSTNFPTTSGVIQPLMKGSADAFVAKLTPAGQGFAYLTYLGGTSGSMLAQEQGNAIAVDLLGQAFVAGVTPSNDFPVTASVPQATCAGNWDAFVVKLNAAGTALLYSTYLGGIGMDIPTGLRIDHAGSAHVVGYTSSTDFPVFLGTQSNAGGLYDAFVTVINPKGSGYYFSTLLGGSGSDSANAVAINETGDILFAGHTSSLDYPLVHGLPYTHSNGYIAFTAKISGNFATATVIGDFDHNGVPDLVWQNDTTRQVTVNYYAGTGQAFYQGWNWLNASGSPGWHVVAIADFNGDGVPDLVWQNDTTRQVTVNYYAGTAGAFYQGWNWLNISGSPGWHVVAVADFNGDGVPDLVWQNDTTRQVTVNYYGGSGGATLTAWNWLNISGSPGWHVVAAADFNGDNLPDLVWQNDTTRQVTVNYYGGSGGATLTGWNWLNISGSPGWHVVAAADFNADGVPDLVWQNDTTRQVTVHYFGGTGGASDQGWNWLNTTINSGWSLVKSGN